MSQNTCPACRSRHVKEMFKIPDHEYRLSVQAIYHCCADCLTLYQVPMPDENQLAEFYPQNYHSFAKKTVIMKIRHQLRIKRLAKFLPETSGVLLDYGCGDGSFLFEAAKHLAHVTFFGYEIQNTKEIRRFLNGRVTILKGRFQDLVDEIPACDLITMNHVIEHLPDPEKTLTQLYGKLLNNGTLEGQTPAADSLEHKIFKTRWSGFHSPRHTVVFSRKGLYNIFQRSGFSQTKVSPAFNPGGIAVSLGSIPHGDKPGTIQRQGLYWLLLVFMAALLYPIDLLSGQPGVINFYGTKSHS